jgi:hypothetical protein
LSGTSVWRAANTNDAATCVDLKLVSGVDILRDHDAKNGSSGRDTLSTRASAGLDGAIAVVVYFR